MPGDPDLRIDGTGTVHPVGRQASQELRARSGEWRLLASPPEVLFAARAGDRERPLRLAGEVRTPGGLCDVLATMAHGGWGGELVVFEDGAVRSIFFDGGNVVGASTSAAGERLGEILWRFGAITRAQLDEVVRAADKSGKRLGEVAIDLEFVGSDELFRMMARQVEEVFYAAAHVGHATFFVFDGFDEARLARRHHLSAGQLLMEAARRMDELRFFREKIPSDSWVPTVLPSGSGKKPPPELADVLAQCDGRRSVAEIGRRIGQLEFEVTRSIFQLVAAGLVGVGAPRLDGPVAVVDAFNRALVEIHGACDKQSKGRELRAGLDQFATSTGVYGPLFTQAGPLADGSVHADRVARNVAALAGEDDAEGWLTEQLFEYAGFALFHAGTLLPRGEEVGLNVRVAEMLKPLRQQPEGGAPPPSRRSPPSSSPASRRSHMEK